MEEILMVVDPEGCVQLLNAPKPVIAHAEFPPAKQPFKVYIYCLSNKKDLLFRNKDGKYELVPTKDFRKGKFIIEEGMKFFNNSIVADFICDTITPFTTNIISDQVKYAINNSQFNLIKMYTNILQKYKTAYLWKINELKKYDIPIGINKKIIKHLKKNAQFTKILGDFNG